MSAATVAYDSLENLREQDSSTSVAARPNTLVSNSFRGASSPPPGEKLHANANFAVVSRFASLKHWTTLASSPIALSVARKRPSCHQNSLCLEHKNSGVHTLSLLAICIHRIKSSKSGMFTRACFTLMGATSWQEFFKKIKTTIGGVVRYLACIHK